MWTRVLFFFMHKTAYELRISDWSSDVCSSDLEALDLPLRLPDPQSAAQAEGALGAGRLLVHRYLHAAEPQRLAGGAPGGRLRADRRRGGAERRPAGLRPGPDRRSTRLNSSH